MSADTRQSQYFASLWARHFGRRRQVPGRRSLARVAIALLIAVTGVWAAVSFRDSAIAGASSPTPSNGVCPVVTASQWQLPYSPYTTGTQYDVKVKGYSCAKADTYIKTLVAHKVSSGYPATVKGGPPGWKCTGSRSKTGLAYTGTCVKNSNAINGTFFGWSVG